ncbi:hypothetical protein [Rathayibacter toxicus]|uniref:Uncharacterized protein n=1 Tax=Rathayibacter toxicus TaxID=145458 RepID=A0A2S5Y546_9MICO|nr:hypothetical protein [Rathayibacter toxicus]PPH21687.1 hypothetical protein C5D17_09055 [Rathayibacter toxicus]PPH56116.1 hypothetical protein C5D30_09045 [Rathayibacter toxicus]PPH58212.1 hypothetical protein C5C93_09095 [Rathayibacter toxicus]PPH85958.1 hypothetical protein C5D31_09075 [Rathayibacter toxicus]PPI13842.1 hypothetical protein C5C51_09020 [Rathayibacter toxicus]
MTTSPDGVTEHYRPLHEVLLSASAGDVVLTLDEIKSILGFELLERARQDPFWWAPVPRNSWAPTQLKADRLATLDAHSGTVTFSIGSISTVEDLGALTAQRRREDNYAREALLRGPVATEIRDRWWEPHLVYIIHVHAERLYKVGLTRHDTHRLRDLTARGRADIVNTLLMADRWSAKLVEVAVLDTTDSTRRVAWPIVSITTTGKRNTGMTRYHHPRFSRSPR